MKCRTNDDAIELTKKSAQNFDTHKIFHIKAGKKIINYDFIQENNVDTDIYQTLEKYGTLKPIEIDAQAISAEFEKMDLRDIYNKKSKANEMWLNLPLDIRKEFNNDISEFMQKGKQWVENKIKANKENEIKTDIKTDTNSEIKEKIDEQK